MKSAEFLRLFIAVALITPATHSPALADREPVLRQIDVPHHYYFREMYLPQVSAGPQSPAWSPDGRSLVYSMQGSLWRQSLDSTTAVQLTAGPGYDYQPDWSADGHSIVFARYANDAMELQVYDIETGKTRQLTSGGNVNLEPRWSPDGMRLAFVSTKGTGRFHIFTGSFDGDQLKASRLSEERQSDVARYYYSSYDHHISPSWSPDGHKLAFVSNPETPYGSGGIWERRLDDASPPTLVRSEETTWRARPDIAPDGRRVVYSSYLGRQWHQLWITTVDGKGEPFPLTYGDYDATYARWSPEGERIAFTVNESGNTSLRIITVPGGKATDLDIAERQYLAPMGSIRLSIMDESAKEMPARVSIIASDGRFYAPQDSWMHADDSFDRGQRSEEARYFNAYGKTRITLPQGPAKITVWRGPESAIEKRELPIKANVESALTIQTHRLKLPADWTGWHSGDVHVHMNYGGIYRNTPENLVRQGQAEDLDLIFSLVVNKEQRIPDVSYFAGAADLASNKSVVLQHSQEFHTSYWGHLGLLGLSDHLLLPGYSAYPETAAASLYPDNAAVEDMAHAQGGITGYVHPFDYPLPDPASSGPLTNALPIDVALGQVDYYEVVGFADHRASAEIWYRLLNCGFHLSAAGGTDAMANYASLRGPVGMNRTYVQTNDWPTDPNARRNAWLKGLKAGRSFASNGPILGFTVEGNEPGSMLDFDKPRKVAYRGFMRSAVPLDELEVVFNGNVVNTIKLAGDSMSADFDGNIDIAGSGWLLLRASARNPHPDLFDMYPYATTSPIYIDIGKTGPRSDAAADYFIAWIARSRESAVAHEHYNSASERESVLRHIDDATAEFERRRSH